MRWVGATAAAAVLAVVGVGCSDEVDPSTAATLPAIVTTTTIPSTAAPTTTQPRFYRIEQGDTLSDIAKAYGLPQEAIMQRNAITDANQIFVGQILELPLASEFTTTTQPPSTTAIGPVASPAFTTVAP